MVEVCLSTFRLNDGKFDRGNKGELFKYEATCPQIMAKRSTGKPEIAYKPARPAIFREASNKADRRIRICLTLIGL